ncbi:Beta-1,3-galactosyltransferase 4 [Phytophthora boehmeriae]|uniref:Hexosyltransferase n=1 Tax=Phytophthora boehmeriae TaxID=109152 RepID=A0A8T1WUU8_9STRA|nr:Beta-1,3-galactosyltransferase 4 [Phytophthora boehmeriae]
MTLIVENLAAGNHTAQIVLTDSSTPGTGKRLQESEEVPFTILSSETFAAMMEQQRRDDLALYGAKEGAKETLSVLEWSRLEQVEGDAVNTEAHGYVMREVDAATGQVNSANREFKGTPTDPPLLVVGVKTRVVAGFPFRQAIRETWASNDNLPQSVRVFFAGCRLPADASDEIRQAVALEQRVYGDLLTDDLDCEDSYAGLTVKVKEFIHFVGSDHVLRRAKFVMIADEDVYLRAGDLAGQLANMGPLRDVYAGHVKDGTLFRPERTPQHRYYLPESEYPMDEFPPFAWGPHYFMSMDVAEFIVDNREELQGLRGLDDVSVALWLLAIQVHPQHIAHFKNLREAPCADDIIAYADLGPTAMRIIQSNLRANRSFCHGFNAHTWDKNDFLRSEMVPSDASLA